MQHGMEERGSREDRRGGLGRVRTNEGSEGNQAGQEGSLWTKRDGQPTQRGPENALHSLRSCFCIYTDLFPPSAVFLPLLLLFLPCENSFVPSPTASSTPHTPDTMAAFTPITVGKMQLTNRIALAPLTRFRNSDSHAPKEISAEYYRQRGSYGGTALITEATVISPEAGHYKNAPGICT